jgi:hypothetical protein
MVAARSWRLLVHGGRSFMVAARSWQLSVNNGGLSIGATYSLWVSIHFSGLFISVAIEPQLSYICLSKLITIGLVCH